MKSRWMVCAFALLMSIVIAALPALVSPVSAQEKSAYSKKVTGKLWIEGFSGPSRFNPGALKGGVDLPRAPKVRGPESGAALLGKMFGFWFVGVVYRQANYDFYKLMKVGLAQQLFFRTPYVQPTIRFDAGYSRIFDGSIYPIDGSAKQGYYFTGGVGIRVPIVRWLSLAATFDGTGGGLTGDVNADFTQFGGTFALTVHLIDVDKEL